MTGKQPFQRVDGLGIGNTIATAWAKVHLKGANDGLRPAIKLIALPDIVAEGLEVAPEIFNVFTAMAFSQVPGRRSNIAVSSIHSPTPWRASAAHGNFSPGSTLRPGATSECASTWRG
jgi:hypothetical protein